MNANFDGSCLETKVFKICLDGSEEVGKGKYRVDNLGVSFAGFIDKLLSLGFRVESIKPYRGVLSGNKLVAKTEVLAGQFRLIFLPPSYLEFHFGEASGWCWGMNIRIEGRRLVLEDTDEQIRNLVKILGAKYKITLLTKDLSYVLSKDKLLFVDLLDEVAFELEPYGHKLYYPALIGDDLDGESILQWFISVLENNEIEDVKISDGVLLGIGNTWYKYNQDETISFGYEAEGLKVRFNSFKAEIVGRGNDFSGMVDSKTLGLYFAKLKEKIWNLAKFYLF